MKFNPTNTGNELRYRLKGDTGPATYTVEGLATLVLLQKITPATEIAPVGDPGFQPISAWPFADTLFPPKRKFAFKPPLEPKPFALPPLEITGEEELREIMRRDPNDIRVTMLHNLISELAATEGRPVPELLEEFFARKREHLAAGKPTKGDGTAKLPATVRTLKNVTPRSTELSERIRALLGS